MKDFIKFYYHKTIGGRIWWYNEWLASLGCNPLCMRTLHSSICFGVLHIDPCEKICHFCMFSCFLMILQLLNILGIRLRPRIQERGHVCLLLTCLRERVSTDPIIRWVFFLLIHVYILLKCFKFFFRSWYFLNHYKTEKCCFYNNKSITHTDGLTELLLRLVIDWYILRYDIWILLKEEKHQFLELQVQNISNVWWFWY